ncbi:MAG: hypothetical protein KJO05_01615 [Bacteroidia bacterium]|nr:hypothetical protein [Bacteroidia bacterium]NNF31391.1 hypothetical protein [Flavobacteriaceae bacterium]MBT8275942.1 hypothetical protein [Bacteroidia bacterium]NNJ81675.1 hypothetical protein [Flavobacteriaceae bacterium]NNK53017.1 hypothetical protein [Flavobacteriaceae bacterium]
MRHQNDYLLGSYMDPEDELENESEEGFENEFENDLPEASEGDGAIGGADNGIRIDPRT